MYRTLRKVAMYQWRMSLEDKTQDGALRLCECHSQCMVMLQGCLECS